MTGDGGDNAVDEDGAAGMGQLVARSTVSRCVVGSSPHGADHFGFPQCSATG